MSLRRRVNKGYLNALWKVSQYDITAIYSTLKCAQPVCDSENK